jgi:hypothetical protein
MQFTPMQYMLILGETRDPWSDALKTGALTGLQLKACAVALEQFSKRYPTAQLDHFTVIAKDETDGFEVIFLPECDNWQERGGVTKYGDEVHYVVSRDKFEIVRTYFGR